VAFFNIHDLSPFILPSNRCARCAAISGKP
jgi:hypothetical protein